MQPDSPIAVAPPGGRSQILIVDDVPTNVVVLGKALADDYDVRFATSGQEAIDLALKSTPDLMLLDVMMPGMSGHEVQRIMRQHPLLRDVAVIFVTADTSPDSELQGLRQGAEDYINKPIVVPILLARVKNVLERHRRRKELELSLSGAEQGLWEWYTHGEQVNFNADWAVPLGYARGEMSPCTMTWQHVVHPDDWPTLFAARDAYLAGQLGLFDPEIRMRHKNDSFVWMQLHGKAVEFDPAQQPVKMMGTYMNISRRKRAELDLREREAQLATMIASLQDVVLVLDQAGMITMYHVPAGSELDFLSSDLVGKSHWSALPDAMAAQIDAAIFEIRTFNRPVQNECELSRNGQRTCLHLSINMLAGSDQAPTGYLIVAQDITAQKQAEEEIRTLAFYDSLTGLPNRRMARDRLRQALSVSARSRHVGALLFVNLDDFKRLEHTQGRSAGDQLLRETGRRLQQCVRDNDLVARLGSDEFLVLLEALADNHVDTANSVSRIGAKILGNVDQPLTIGGEEFRITASIGAVLFVGQQFGEEELLQQAELAMYSAKNSGRNRLKFFDPEMQASVLTRVALEQSIHKGLQHGDFFLLYQPQVDRQGRVIGAEALVRWQHPEKGVLGPGYFIPLAEDTELIVPLGQYILRVACQQLYRWQQQPASAHLSLAVNVSSRQFEKAGFVDEVEQAIQTSRIDPRFLKLEITESLLLENTDSVIEKMLRLRDIGVSFSLDDFGTGYSSLTYLKKLPLDQLKIDQSFVRNALASSVDCAIIRAIMTLGSSLGISVIAEGVETAAEWQFLLGEGCSQFQGYHFSRPCPAAELEAMLGAAGASCAGA